MRGGRQAVQLAPAPSNRPTDRTLLTSLLAALLCAWGTPLWADESDDEDTSDEDEPEVTDRVEVVDTRAAPTADALTHRSPASAVVIDVDPDALPAGATVGDLLDDVAGVDIRRFGGPGDPSFVRIRGSSAQQVEVYVDGVPLNAHGSSSIDLSEIALDAYDRIEIHRSGAPPELGASPIGGVVHLRTRPDAPPATRVGARYGSWHTRAVWGETGSAAAFRDGSVGTGRLSIRYDGSRGDYRFFTHNGTLYNLRDDRILRRANNRFDQLDTTASLSLQRGPLRISGRDRILWRHGGVPGTAGAQTHHSWFGVLDNLLAGRAELDLGPTVRLLGDLAWRFRQEEFSDREGEVGTGSQASRDRYQQPAMGLTAELRPTPWLTVLPSARLAIDTYAPVNLLGDPDTYGERVRLASTFKVAADLSLWEDRVAVVPAVALHVLDNRFLGPLPYADTPHAVDGQEVVAAGSPSVSLAFRPLSFLTIRGGATAFAFRPPTFLELFGDRGNVAGRPGLVPETAHSVDGSVRVRSPRNEWLQGSAEVGGFATDTRNTIVWGVNSQGVATPGNLGRTFVTGMELAGSLDALRHLSVTGSATYTWSTILEGRDGTLDNRLPNVPLWQVHVGVEAFWDPYVRVGWRFDFTDGSFDSTSNFFPQAPRPLHSLHARVQPHPRSPWISVEVSNLTDHIVADQFRDPLHPDEDDRTVVAVQDFRGNPLPGRAIFVSVGWTHRPPPKTASQDDPE